MKKESGKAISVPLFQRDGFSFRKLGPVIGEVPGYTPHVRDPKVFRGEQGEFYMVLGAQREDLTGDTILYRSMDLKNWEFLGSLLAKREGPGVYVGMSGSCEAGRKRCVSFFSSRSFGGWTPL